MLFTLIAVSPRRNTDVLGWKGAKGKILQFTEARFSLASETDSSELLVS